MSARLFAGALVAVLVFGGALWLQHRAYGRGWDEAMATVAAQNNAARKAAEKAQTAVDGCFERGGDWDVATASCRL